jgi:hypothetical protein
MPVIADIIWFINNADLDSWDLAIVPDAIQNAYVRLAMFAFNNAAVDGDAVVPDAICRDYKQVSDWLTIRPATD